MKPRLLLALAAVSGALLGGCDSEDQSASQPSVSPTEAMVKAPDTGLRVQLSYEPNGPSGHIKIKLEIRDNDAGSDEVTYALDFGDGTGYHSRGKPIAACVANATPPPVHPIAKSHQFSTFYPDPGTYQVTAIVGTYSVCAGPPDETRTATLTVRVE